MHPIDYMVNTFFIPFLQLSYTHVIANYGVAILLLTAMIKLIFYPLTNKQFQSMKATQKMQPEMKAIQAKFKGEPQKLQAEMKKLFKAHNANPLGGCLPALVQLPFFLAIFYTIKSEAFANLLIQPGANPGLFTFWLADLAAKDGTYILPVVMAASSYWSQKLITNPASGQPNFLAFMPVIMFFISMTMPAGVLLYWATSQLLSAGQQYLVMKGGTGKVEIIKAG